MRIALSILFGGNAFSKPLRRDGVSTGVSWGEKPPYASMPFPATFVSYPEISTHPKKQNRAKLEAVQWSPRTKSWS
jgi:hypothetical protein